MEMVRCISEGISTTLDMNRENMKAVEKDVQTIKSCLKELTACWEGPAHDTYHSEFNYAMDSLADIIKRSNEILDFEELAYQKYLQADKKASDRVKTLWASAKM